MNRLMRPLLVATLVLALPAAWAAELGDAAAPLKIKDWVKGKAVEIKADSPTKVYVVEFWATWCPPCRVSIPHLTGMAKKYKDKGVVFIGVSNEDSAKVKPFVEKMGAKMDYVVAVDDDKATTKSYMEAYKMPGIPTAFVVDQKGKVVWVGHPLVGLDQVVEKVAAGTSDTKALKEISAKEEETLNQTGKAVQEYMQKITSGTGDKPTFPENLLKGDINPLLSQSFNGLAWTILTDEKVKSRDLGLALRAAKIANDLTGGDDPAVLDTYARALWDNGKKDEALKTQQKAVSVATDDKMKAELQQRLDEYKSGTGKGDK